MGWGHSEAIEFFSFGQIIFQGQNLRSNGKVMSHEKTAGYMFENQMTIHDLEGVDPPPRHFGVQVPRPLPIPPAEKPSPAVYGSVASGLVRIVASFDFMVIHTKISRKPGSCNNRLDC